MSNIVFENPNKKKSKTIIALPVIYKNVENRDKNGYRNN
jgi:hypothetical protein